MPEENVKVTDSLKEIHGKRFAPPAPRIDPRPIDIAGTQMLPYRANGRRAILII